MDSTVISRLLDNYSINTDGWIYTEDTLLDLLYSVVCNDRLLHTLYYYIIAIMQYSRHTVKHGAR